ncbi:MAG TPA: hypothetical protein VMF06_18120 [Candidatus Limnocylindria bacterium]|nr:hypothetical protein [Candidatus Limnocylindria bacterium]
MITQGRSALGTQKYAEAELLFQQAQRADPADSSAHALHAFSRVLALPERAPVKAMLDLLGTAPGNRNFLRWTAHLSRGLDGKLRLPPGVSLQAVADAWRTNIVKELAGAEADLSQVVDSHFSLTLSAAETTTVETTVDFADLQLLRAVCHGERYLSLTAYSWDLDAQLDALNSLFAAGDHTIEEFLRKNPSFLTFRSAEEFAEARIAFEQAVTRYVEASQLIISRPLTSIRLINWDPAKAVQESDFRRALEGLRTSLDGTNRYESRYNLARQFVPGLAPRPLLPQFSGSSFVVGSLPDPTFGGLVAGYTRSDFETFAFRSKKLGNHSLGGASHAVAQPDGEESLALQFTALPGVACTVLASEDLREWIPYTNMVPQADTVTVRIPASNSFRFYRTAIPREPINATFDGRIHLDGKDVRLREAFGSWALVADWFAPFGAELWFEWVAPADGFFTVYDEQPVLAHPDLVRWDMLQGDSLLQLTYFNVCAPVSAGQHIVLRGRSLGALTETMLRVHLVEGTTTNDRPSRAVLMTGSPVVTHASLAGLLPTPRILPGPQNVPDGRAAWFRWSAPRTGTYALRHNIGGAAVYVYNENDPSRLDYLQSSSLRNIRFSADSGQVFYFAFLQTYECSYQDQADVEVTPFTPPANDDYTAAAVLEGVRAEYQGSMLDATFEPSEPDSGLGQSTVWFKWISPVTGMARLEFEKQRFRPRFSVYEGDSLGNLRSVLPSSISAFGLSSFDVVAGASYSFQVAPPDELFTNYRMRLEAASYPSNDNRIDAAGLPGDIGILEGSTLGASVESNEPATMGPGGTVWYSWQAPADGMFFAGVSRSAFEPGLHLVYFGSPVIAVRTGSFPGRGSEWRVSKGENYLIQVQNVHGSDGRFLLSWKFLPD